jgi:PAS domain S-box-containing protein
MSDEISSSDKESDGALATVLKGVATETGERFFFALAENLARALGTHASWVTEYIPDRQRLRAIAFWLGGRWIEDFEYPIAGTPCETAIDEERLIHIPDNIMELYPDDPDVRLQGGVSYLGVPLKDTDGAILGHLAVMSNRPMPEDHRALAIFQIFATRAEGELQRIRRERAIREREQKLRRLIDGAMDAIIELDRQLHVTHLNPAAAKTFECDAQRAIGSSFLRFLDESCSSQVQTLVRQLDDQPEGEQFLWMPSGITARKLGGGSFLAEATVSRSEMNGEVFYTMILRNVDDRIEAERRIQLLSRETEYLRQEITSILNFGEIIGQSRPLARVLEDIRQVAATDSTVLVTGETGTGKELIARAVHLESGRKDKPLVTVNCAAIPATLIESEFFGHERGAFTGATSKRIGRFALADKGTLFLDEIGELPLDLQSKLLRALQSGEYQAVGSSETRKADVRVIAATNRDLKQAASQGTFREDLYYRINVFPIHVPPLRERGEDIVLLAAAFANQFARKQRRPIAPLTPEHARRLKAYSWPGNVRELQNVIERAVITSVNGRLNLDRSLPEEIEAAPPGAPLAEDDGRIHTVAELQELERANIRRALKRAGGRVAGKDGAASLLGIPASTLSSRMKALGIDRPAAS